MGRLGPRECRGPDQPTPDARLSEAVFAKQPADGIGNRSGVVWRHEKASIAGDLGKCSAIGSDDRHPECHGLEHWKAEALVPRGEHQERGTFEERASFGVGDVADICLLYTSDAADD